MISSTVLLNMALESAASSAGEEFGRRLGRELGNLIFGNEDPSVNLEQRITELLDNVIQVLSEKVELTSIRHQINQIQGILAKMNYDFRIYDDSKINNETKENLDLALARLINSEGQFRSYAFNLATQLEDYGFEVSITAAVQHLAVLKTISQDSSDPEIKRFYSQLLYKYYILYLQDIDRGYFDINRKLDNNFYAVLTTTGGQNALRKTWFACYEKTKHGPKFIANTTAFDNGSMNENAYKQLLKLRDELLTDLRNKKRETHPLFMGHQKFRKNYIDILSAKIEKI